MLYFWHKDKEKNGIICIILFLCLDTAYVFLSLELHILISTQQLFYNKRKKQ